MARIPVGDWILNAIVKRLFDDIADELAELKAIVDFMRTGVAATGGVRPSGGASGLTLLMNNTFMYRLDGVPLALNGGSPMGAPASTNGPGEFSKDLWTIGDPGGPFSVVAGVKAASQAEAVVPDTPAGRCPVAYVEIPESFTPGVDNILLAWVFEIVMPDMTLRTIKAE